MKASKRTRSPLKDRALRNPGQSLDERKRNLVMDRLLYPLMVALVLSIFAVLEISRAYFNSPPMPVLWMVTAIVAVAWAAYRVSRTMPAIRALTLAQEGEKAVGQYLEKLRAEGYEIFHDLQGQGFNVDHVIVGPAGVFTVETKTWSKPKQGSPTVRFDGEKLLAAGLEPDRNPIVQARAQSSWIGELIKESTGRRYHTKAVVLFPGWFVEQDPGATREVWVLNPKAFPEFLRHEPVRHSPEEVRLASYGLSRFIRQVEREA